MNEILAIYCIFYGFFRPKMNAYNWHYCTTFSCGIQEKNFVFSVENWNECTEKMEDDCIVLGMMKLLNTSKKTFFIKFCEVTHFVPSWCYRNHKSNSEDLNFRILPTKTVFYVILVGNENLYLCCKTKSSNKKWNN